MLCVRLACPLHAAYLTHFINSDMPNDAMFSVSLFSHTHTHTHIYIYIYTHTHTHIYIYIYTHIHTHTYMQTHTNTIYIYIYIHICTHTHTHICTYTHIHIHTHTQTHIRVPLYYKCRYNKHRACTWKLQMKSNQIFYLYLFICWFCVLTLAETVFYAAFTAVGSHSSLRNSGYAILRLWRFLIIIWELSEDGYET